VSVESGTVDIRNNIFYCNTSDTGHNVIAVRSTPSASVTIEYNNSFGNTDGSTSQDYTGGTGNINSDPLFSLVIPAGAYGGCPPGGVRSYQLLSSSPSIDAGDPDSAHNDVDGTSNDQGAYGGPNGDW
jgi:hypothetical protein